ncbi:MAG: S9 family peptidase, partial [Planctomycetes bacterium]|nr:S9 family peptidase [Planctomycetota bacterium]
MRNTLLRLAALSCALWFGLEVCAQEARTLTPMDVHRLRSVIGVYPIPDGHHVAFTRLEPRHPDEDPGGARVHLYWVDLRTGEERLLIGGQQSVGGVAVSPDAKYLSFVGRRDDAPHAEVYGLPLDGGEPIRLTTTPHGVSSYAWRPDGKSIAFTRTRAAPAERASAQRAGFSPVIVDEQWNPIDLFLYDRATKTIRTLDEGRAVHGIRWSPDGRRLVAGIAPRNLIDDTYMATRLFEIAVDGAPQDHGLSVDNPGKLGDFAISPNGLMLAYVSASDRRDPHAGMLFLRSAVDGSERCLTTDFEGMVHDLHWWSDTMIHATISVGLKTYVTSIKVSDGTMTQLAGGRGLAFHGFATMPQEPELVFVNGSTAQHPDELFSLTITSGTAPRRWTRSNPWLNEVQLGKQTNEVITARDGLAIEGLLIHPVGYEAKTRYPLVIVAHGGPESHFSEGWLTRYSEWGQMLAGRGYFAWYPNYRSSTGRGVAFAKKDHGDPMGAEFEDHLDAIAAFAERGLIDLDRVGLGGGSYG